MAVLVAVPLLRNQQLDKVPLVRVITELDILVLTAVAEVVLHQLQPTKMAAQAGHRPLAEQAQHTLVEVGQLGRRQLEVRAASVEVAQHQVVAPQRVEQQIPAVVVVLGVQVMLLAMAVRALL
jgi:hypothetical protein